MPFLFQPMDSCMWGRIPMYWGYPQHMGMNPHMLGPVWRGSVVGWMGVESAGVGRGWAEAMCECCKPHCRISALLAAALWTFNTMLMSQSRRPDPRSCSKRMCMQARKCARARAGSLAGGRAGAWVGGWGWVGCGGVGWVRVGWGGVGWVGGWEGVRVRVRVRVRVITCTCTHACAYSCACARARARACA
jgi:hypothetical protein